MRLQGKRGFNIIYGLWKARREYGLDWPPNTFDVVRGDPSTEMSYEQFCAALAQAGVNWMRVKLTGWGNPLGVFAAPFEPPPAGTFNIWQSALDPAYLNVYRAEQVTIPIPADVWANSNVGQFILAAEKHGITLDLILFDNREFRDAWARHPWNLNNQYINGARCEAQDRGFLADARDIFSHPEAIAAAKARIDAALAVFEGHESVIGSWEIMAEQTWLATPTWWGLDSWGAEFTARVRLMRDWNELIAQYIHSKSSAPVGISQAFENAVRTNSIRAELYDAPDLDWVGVNAYGKNAVQAHDWLRVAQARYPDAQIIVQQYHPNGTSAGYESAPFRTSKSVEWAIACADPGFTGPLRWVDTSAGTYASANLREIAGVTSRMGAIVAEHERGAGGSWDEGISSQGLALAASWGDGYHVTAFLDWVESGDKTVTLSGLSGTSCVVHTFDYLTGELAGIETVPVAGGNAVFTVPTRDTRAAVCVVPEIVVPPQPDPERTLDVSAVLKLDGQPAGVFEGTLVEVKP